MTKDKRAATAVRLSDMIKRRLELEAKVSGATVSEVIRAAIAEYLDRREADRKVSR